MDLLEMLQHTKRSKGGVIMDGYDESVEHPTMKRRQFEDEVLWRLRDLESKVRFQYFMILFLSVVAVWEIVWALATILGSVFL